MIRTLCVENLLSFGPDAAPLPLADLNVLIGPNAAGKSNVFRALELLAVAPSSLSEFVRESGAGEWMHVGARKGSLPTVRVSLDLAVNDHPPETHDYVLKLDLADAAKPVVAEETLSRQSDKHVLMTNKRGVGRAEGAPGETDFVFNQLSPLVSFLQQVRVPGSYAATAALSDLFTRWAFYLEPWVGSLAPGRFAQQADLPSDSLSPDGTNLALVLHERNADPTFGEKLRETMREVFDGFEGFHTRISGGLVQLRVRERIGNRTVEIPSTRLSDGTLHFLALFTLLADPRPPPLLCIEEPEIGLHPDAIGTLAALLKDAATRTQVIVTTHSSQLVDALSDRPDAIVVCERHDGATSLRRLDGRTLEKWLDEYSLGTLWRRGDLGGNRW